MLKLIMQIIFILLELMLVGVSLYLCINGIILGSFILAGSGGALLGVVIVGIAISFEYRNNPTPPSSPIIIVVDQENPINIVQKKSIEKVDITRLDPSTVV